MALISDALGIVVAIIIFILVVLLFFKVFGSAECDKLAKSTAEELRIGIDRVALEDKVSPYYGQGIPPDNAKDQFTVVPIRLCQRAGVGGVGIFGLKIPGLSTGAALSAEIPDYILVYETFPESPWWAAWSESKPFESGAVTSFMTYAMIRWGPKLIYNIGKFIAKIPGMIGGLFLKLPSIGEKISNSLSEIKDNGVINWMLRSSSSSEEGGSIAENIPERFVSTLYDKEYRSTIENLRYMVFEARIDEFDAMANLGIIEAEWDDVAGKYIPITTETLADKGIGVVRDEMYIVKPEFKQLFKTYIDLTPNEELKQLYKESFYIPSWGERFGTEEIKEVWYESKYSVSNNRFTDWFGENVIDKTTDTYDDLKDGFNKVFHRTADQFDAPAKAAAYKKWAFMHFDQFRSNVLDEDNFYNMGFQKALEDVTGKALSNPSLVSDEDLYNFLVKYDRYYNSFPYEEFISSSTGQVRTFAVSNMQDILSDSATNAIDEGDIAAFGRLKNQFKWSWDMMPSNEQDAWMENMMQGYTGSEELSRFDAGVIFSDLRAHLIKEGALDESNIITVGGLIRANKLTSIVDKIKGDMFTEPLNYNFIQTDEFANAIPNYWLRPVAPATETWFQKFKDQLSGSVSALRDFKDQFTKSIIWKKTKQFVILDMGRFGFGPLSPFDPLAGGGALTTRQALKRSTQIMEGGCAERSICMLKQGGVEGPEPGASAFLLDEKIPKGTEVKIWRPKPDIGVRTPSWISTALFYASAPENPRFHVISPCFATAKIWKSGTDGKIYVNIDKANKCDVSSCPSGIDTPNYCYADEDYIWGEPALSRGNMITTGDAPSASIYVGGTLGCAAALSVATQGNFWASLKTCSYISIGVLTAHTIGATQAYRDVTSWKRQETGWGYWNYQKANDVCNVLDIMASIGSWQVGKTLGVTQLSELSKPSTVSKIKGWIGPGDLCYFLLIVGDTSLSWPVKTAFPEVWRKGAGLNETCMQDTAAECAWLNKTV